MHIHGNPMQLRAANLPSAAETEKAGEARQAAEVRARLLDSSREMDGELNPETQFLVGRWPEGNSGRREGQNRGQRGASVSAEAGMDDVEPADQPVSVWA